MSVGKITFRITNPASIVDTLRVEKVVLPASNGNITILPNRAPTLVLLQHGVVKTLTEQNEVVEQYFVGKGVADVARDRCVISSERAYSFDNMSKQKAEEKLQQAQNDDDKAFFQMILNHYQG